MISRPTLDEDSIMTDFTHNVIASIMPKYGFRYALSFERSGDKQRRIIINVHAVDPAVIVWSKAFTVKSYVNSQVIMHNSITDAINKHQA